MTKAATVFPRIHTGDPQEWLAGVLRSRFQEVLSHHGAAMIETQIEGIHDMRVSIRRLRSVIRDFAEISEKFPLKPIRKDLKQLADALGKVRDLDVAIEALERHAEKLAGTDIADGIETFTRRVRKRRVEEFEKLRPHLLPSSMEKLTYRIERALNNALGQRSLFAAKTYDDAKEEIISNRVGDFLKLADALYDPQQIRRHHRLRIASKHLRYAIELFSTELQNDKPDPAKLVSEMQSHLGDMHDCDVWIAEIRRGLHAKKNNELRGSDRRAAVWLLSQFVRRRTKAYRSALNIWSEWEQTGFLSNEIRLVK